MALFHLAELLGGTNYKRNEEHTEPKHVAVIRLFRPQGYSKIETKSTVSPSTVLMTLLPHQPLCDKKKRGGIRKTNGELKTTAQADIQAAA